MAATRLFTIYVETDELYFEFVEIESRTESEAIECVKEKFKNERITELEVYSDFALD